MTHFSSRLLCALLFVMSAFLCCADKPTAKKAAKSVEPEIKVMFQGAHIGIRNHHSQEPRLGIPGGGNADINEAFCHAPA